MPVFPNIILYAIPFFILAMLVELFVTIKMHIKSYETKDAFASISKLKKNGILIFNDYIMHDHIANYPYGIVQVVNELCVNHDWKITALALESQMFCDVALERSN